MSVLLEIGTIHISYIRISTDIKIDIQGATLVISRQNRSIELQTQL